MSNNREEKIDQWIFQDGVKKSRRSKIIPSSTDSIKHAPVGTALDAMEKVAFYLGDRPELPIVELGLIKESEITLTFAANVHLDAPFWQVSDEYDDQWAITHHDAFELSTGHVYGLQTAALTAIGNSLAGAKVLLNTNRWSVLGSVGLKRFSLALMVGQVMEQATEPWAKEHHIWLVGYQELGPKLVHFLAQYHDESRFHLVGSVEQITAEDLEGTSATLYVMGSTEASLEAFNLIKGQNVGMLSDTVLTERAMFISEDDDEGATILNATPDGMKIWPNLVAEGDPLYEAMEMTWQKNLDVVQEAQKAVESLKIEDFLQDVALKAEAPAQETPELPPISAAELEALVNFEPEVEPVNTPEQAEQTPEVEVSPSDKALEPVLMLLGAPQVRGADGLVVTGKPAEAVAFLHFNGFSQDGIELSQALWPDSESEGNTARTRRSRTAKKIKDALPDSFSNSAEWVIDPLTTDFDQIVMALGQDGNPQDVLDACRAVEVPLQDCAEWAVLHRKHMVEQLQQLLDDTIGRALENDQFDIAKAARQASKKL